MVNLDLMRYGIEPLSPIIRLASSNLPVHERFSLKLAGPEGVEPPSKRLECLMLPLHQGPIVWRKSEVSIPKRY